MDDTAFDQALVASALRLAAERGWTGVSVAQAARDADLPLDRARRRFPSRLAILLRIGRLADEAALALAASEGSRRDRLFDNLMRRIDYFQANRPGILAILRALPCDPPTAFLVSTQVLASMGWMLEASGISTSGPRGLLRTKGLLGVWLWTLRAWQRDDSQDLAATMAALDAALSRAEQADGWLGGHRSGPSPEPPDGEPDFPPPQPTSPPEEPPPEPPPPPPPASPPV
ncbi:TetR family transcriptional regulator [Rhodovastum atsumiense]|uniref:TetR family transcriptional regulator n=1 Tax=Rhodovastum atsumiense TaxID=504468 RepID=A0A5M6IT90_9PROT|nr:TetR family transcriptional regulator [Rhodovastum atsumiense]KAA5611047.1 TetR family transcriptional regulator [Rhodovastum atsumiense]CAH2600165.1 TetR family transcriptional regulator [Rhodovastum atsumiense]